MPKRKVGRPQRRLTKAERTVLRQFAVGELSAADAAKITGLSKKQVYSLAKPIIDKLGFLRSRRSKRSKVNTAEAQQLYEDGWTLAMLGARYGVGRERVRQRINTSVAVRETPHQRTCHDCGQPYLGRKRSVMCDACKIRRNPRDRCECGRGKEKTAKRCFFCTSRKFPRDAAALLYRAGYGLLDIAGVFGANTHGVARALLKSGVVMRSKGEGLKAARHAREARPVLVALRELTREWPQPNEVKHARTRSAGGRVRTSGVCSGAAKPAERDAEFA